MGLGAFRPSGSFYYKMTVKWKIWYGDGTTWDNTTGSAELAPAVNVCCIVYMDKDIGRRIIHRWDWYYFKDGCDVSPCWGADIHGLLDQLMYDRERRIYAVKQGRTLEDFEFKKILAAAIDDPSFPPKSGNTFLERNEGIR